MLGEPLGNPDTSTAPRFPKPGPIPPRNKSARGSVYDWEMVRKLVPGIAGVAVVLTCLLWSQGRRLPENQIHGRFPEELVYVRSSDDVVSAGVKFTSPK